MSDLTATNCGGGCNSGYGTGNGCNLIFLILLLCCCGGGGNLLGGEGNGCSCDNILWILLILCCCGGGGGFC